jgi:hypothetical protein
MTSTQDRPAKTNIYPFLNMVTKILNCRLSLTFWTTILLIGMALTTAHFVTHHYNYANPAIGITTLIFWFLVAINLRWIDEAFFRAKSIRLLRPLSTTIRTPIICPYRTNHCPLAGHKNLPNPDTDTNKETESK